MDENSGFIALVVIIVIFLVCRELVCWYWKQNEQVALLKEIRDIIAKESGIETDRPTKICLKCGTKNRKVDSHCYKCGGPI